MATTLTPNAIQSSTYVVTAAFTDEDGSAVVPNTVTWSLKAKDGTVINERAEESETPASSVDIVLSGDDLDPGAPDSDVGMILLTVTAPYDSALGSGLSCVAQCWIPVEEQEP
jgi:hypothetical protein